MAERDELMQELNEVFTKIGEMYFEDLKSGLIPSKYHENFNAASDISRKIQEIDDAELAEQGLKRCPICKKTVVLDSVFCNYCGTKFAEEKAEEVEDDAVPVDYEKTVFVGEEEMSNSFHSTGKVCTNCGAKLEPDALFCVECGTKVM